MSKEQNDLKRMDNKVKYLVKITKEFVDLDDMNYNIDKRKFSNMDYRSMGFHSGRLSAFKQIRTMLKEELEK